MIVLFSSDENNIVVHSHAWKILQQLVFEVSKYVSEDKKFPSREAETLEGKPE